MDKKEGKFLTRPARKLDKLSLTFILWCGNLSLCWGVTKITRAHQEGSAATRRGGTCRSACEGAGARARAGAHARARAHALVSKERERPGWMRVQR
eukprot:6191447-Pleurochrysis_carterae.AAC.2